jgi:hypothetical protein
MAKAPISREQIRLRNLYAGLMLEVRGRTDIVHEILQGTYRLPQTTAYELCYLEFRMICELIAIGSLAAHGDIPAAQSARLTKSYKADFILNSLEKLHPDFYPKPNKQIIGANGKVESVEDIKSGFMTKKDLISLYHECGEVLHRGTLKEAKARKAGDFAKVDERQRKIVTLLNHHTVRLIDPDYILIVVMKAVTDGDVHVSLAERVAQSSR